MTRLEDSLLLATDGGASASIKRNSYPRGRVWSVEVKANDNSVIGKASSGSLGDALVEAAGGSKEK